MKILFVITLSELGGAQSVVVQLANYLCRQNQVTVAAGEGDGKMWKMLDSPVVQIRLPHLRRAISPIADALTLRDFYLLYRRLRPDIIHLHSSKAGFLGRLVFPSSKIVYTIHGFDSVRLSFRQFLWLERLMQHACKAIVGVSQYDQKNLLDEGIRHHVSTIYNGIPKPVALECDPFEKLGAYKARILCIARLAYPKRYDIFLEVARLLPDYAFIWIGNQKEVTEPVPSNVFFEGNLMNAGAYNAYADLFMLPSDFEGLPIVIIEAMSCGKPIVASDVGGISEIVRNGENGFVVANKADAFAEKIHYLVKHESVRLAFGKASQAFYEKELTLEKMGLSYLRLYKS